MTPAPVHRQAAGAIPGGKVIAKVGAAVATVAVAAVVINKAAKVANKADDAASGISKLAKTAKKAEGGGEEATRIRHYTNRKGLEGIEQDHVIRASDQNKVFAESANKKVLSPRDAERTYGLKPGRGRDYVETTVPSSRVSKVKNPITKVEELQMKGNVTLSSDANFHRRN